MLILLMTLGSMRSFGEPAARPLTVADAIETTRCMQSARGEDPRGAGVFVSPDGKRYVIVLIRGDPMHRSAAAITSDNIDGGYIQAALQNWSAERSQHFGAEPFGEGLKTGFECAPVFAIDNLTTLLRMQDESWRVQALFLDVWEICSRAHCLHKPGRSTSFRTATVARRASKTRSSAI